MLWKTESSGHSSSVKVSSSVPISQLGGRGSEYTVPSRYCLCIPVSGDRLKIRLDIREGSVIDALNGSGAGEDGRADGEKGKEGTEGHV